MINRWLPTDELKLTYTPIITDFIGRIESKDPELDPEGDYEEIDLTDSGLSPYTLQKLLEGLGYKEGDTQTNGWQWDFWTPMRKDGFKDLLIHGTGATFELKLSEMEE